MVRPRQPKFEELPPFTSSISRIIPGATCTEMLVDEPQVQAWKFSSGQDNGVLKRWPARRVARSGTQVGAELRAAAVFGAILDEPSPLMALMLQQSSDPRGSTFSVYPYAGASAEHMLDTHWVHLTRQQREPLCKKLAISGLKVIQMLESVPEEFGGPKLHRDGKLANWCYHQTGDFFVCIDFGGFCSTSLADWHAVVDTRYIDSCFGQVVDGPGASTSPVVLRVMQSIEDWRYNTTPSLDLFLLALAVIELYLGRLPAAVNYDKYGLERLDEYLAVVCDYQWPDCAELAGAPREMMDFLLWCTEPGPANRPATAAEALQHEWLADQVAAVEEAVAQAAPAWAATNNRLREALSGWHAAPAQTTAPADGSNAGSSSGSEASSCSPADCTTDSSAQLLPGHTSSGGGSSTMACTPSSTASDLAEDAAASLVSSTREASLLLHNHSSTGSPDCCGDEASQQQDPAALAVGGNTSSSRNNEARSCTPAGCTADRSEQLRPGHSSSTMACTTPLAASDPVGDAAASPISSASEALLLLDRSPKNRSSEAGQQQDPAAPADGNSSCSSSSSGSSRVAGSPAGCRAFTSSGQLCPGSCSNSGGGSIMVCTTLCTAFDTSGDQSASSTLQQASHSSSCSAAYDSKQRRDKDK